MACILLDIDGVLHVSGQPIPGAAEAVAELRRAGHQLRFVTNNSTRPRARLAEELREMGFELDNGELQTTPGAAARELAGKRVLALVMAAIVPDLDQLELVGHDAEAVLVGGCDETLEPNQVFSYMNLGRAFSEIQAGASFYCLHKNKWWQTSRGPLLDGGAFVAGLEYATGRGGDRARQAEPFVLRRRARLARRRAGADVARDGRRRGGRARRAPLRDEDGARPHGEVPTRGARDRRGLAGHRRLVARELPRAARGGSPRRAAA